jgi:hypothetical protein
MNWVVGVALPRFVATEIAAASVAPLTYKEP